MNILTIKFFECLNYLDHSDIEKGGIITKTIPTFRKFYIPFLIVLFWIKYKRKSLNCKRESTNHVAKGNCLFYYWVFFCECVLCLFLNQRIIDSIVPCFLNLYPTLQSQHFLTSTSPVQESDGSRFFVLKKSADVPEYSSKKWLVEFIPDSIYCLIPSTEKEQGRVTFFKSSIYQEWHL